MGEYILYSGIEEEFEEYQNKIRRTAEEIRKNEGIIVLVGGTFDHYHPGHVYFLNQARKAGRDYLGSKLCELLEDFDERINLLVNLRNEKRVLNKKGRVEFAENRRAGIVSSHGAVDYATVHPSVESPTLEIAKLVKPDLWVTGETGYSSYKKGKVNHDLGYKVQFRNVERDESYGSSSSISRTLSAPMGELEKKNLMGLVKA